MEDGIEKLHELKDAGGFTMPVHYNGQTHGTKQSNNSGLTYLAINILIWNLNKISA